MAIYPGADIRNDPAALAKGLLALREKLPQGNLRPEEQNLLLDAARVLEGIAWVPCTASLPAFEKADDRKVLAAHGNGNVDVRFYNPRVDKLYPWRGWPEPENDVRYWMFLPKAPADCKVTE